MGIPAPLGIAASGIPPAGDQASAVLSGVLSAVGPGDPFAFRGVANWVLYASVTSYAFATTAGSASASVNSGTGMAIGGAISSVNVPLGTTWKTFSGTSGTLAFPALSLFGLVNQYAMQITGLASTPAGIVGGTVTGPGIPSGTTVLSIALAAIPPTANDPGSPGVVNISALPTITTLNPQLPGAYRFTQTAAGVLAGTDGNAVFTGASVTFSATIQLERSFNGGGLWLPCNIGSGTLAQFNAGTPVSLVFGEPEKQVLYRWNVIAYTSGTINYRISQTGGADESLAIGPLSTG